MCQSAVHQLLHSAAPLEIEVELPEESTRAVLEHQALVEESVLWRGHLINRINSITVAAMTDGSTVHVAVSDKGSFSIQPGKKSYTHVKPRQRHLQTAVASAREEDARLENSTHSPRRHLQAGAVALTVEQKIALATAHNNARCSHGVGLLSWNGSDAQSAVHAAAQCRYEHSAVIDRGGRGETIYAVSFHQEATQVISGAVSEFLAQASNWECLSNSCHGPCAQFTQVVAASVTSFGCSLAMCDEDSPFEERFGQQWVFFVCHYSPASLAIGERPFPAAQCSNSSTCLSNETSTGHTAVAASIRNDHDEDSDLNTTNQTVPLCDDEPDDGSRVDVLVMYTKEALAENNGLLFNLILKARVAVDEMNQGLQNSQIDLQLNLSAVELLELTPGASSADILADLASNPQMQGRRDYWHADIVTLFVAETEMTGGLSMQLSDAGGRADVAFSVVDHNSASNFGFARLVGHNFGCETDGRSATRLPIATFAYGYLHIAEPPYFRTIMGSADGCPAGYGCPLIPYFSGYQDVILNGTAAIIGSNDTADCARAINLTRIYVANYRSSNACATVPAEGSATLSGRPLTPTRSCPNNCNNHGSCDYTTFTCYCRLPWYNTETQVDCSLKKCPNDCGQNGQCDDRSGVCMCNGGWTGVSCSVRVKNHCPNDCTDSVRRSSGTPIIWSAGGGTCDTWTGGCNCVREYTDEQQIHYTHDTAICESHQGNCYHGTDWSTRIEPARVEWRIGEIGTVVTVDARASRPIDSESGWAAVQLLGTYINPVVIVGPATIAESTVATARVRNLVNSDGIWSFELRLQEVECADDDMHAPEAVDWLVIESGAYSTSVEDAGSGTSTRLQAGVFLTNGTGTAAHYEPATHVVHLTYADTAPQTVHVNCGDVVLFTLEPGMDLYRIPDDDCDFNNTDWSDDLIKLSDGIPDEQATYAHSVDISAENEFVEGLYSTSSDFGNECAHGTRVTIRAHPLERGCGSGAGLVQGQFQQQAQYRWPGMRLNDCCYGSELTAGPGSLTCGSGDGWVTVGLSVFTAPPVVFAQLQTYSDQNPAQATVRSVTASGFQLRVQSDVGDGLDHDEEYVGFLAVAVEDATSFSAGRWNKRLFEATRITILMPTSDAAQLHFSSRFGAAPKFFVAPQTATADGRTIVLRRNEAYMSGSASVVHLVGQPRGASSCNATAISSLNGSQLGTLAIEVLVSGGRGQLQGYSLMHIQGHENDGDCGLHSGQHACHNRGHYDPLQSACVCDGRFFGETCEFIYCPRNCSFQGVCQRETGTCECWQGYYGADCGLQRCPSHPDLRFSLVGSGECRGLQGSHQLVNGRVQDRVKTEEDCAEHCADMETCIGYAYNGVQGASSPVDDTNFRCFIYGDGLDIGLVAYSPPAWPNWESFSQPTDANGRVEIGGASAGLADTGPGFICRRGPAACSGRGACDVRTGHCSCYAPFYNHDCGLGDCDPPCANGGVCDHKLARCSCIPPFFGASCELGNASASG
eukprot:SAG31_NODE_165_length_21701_cov_9.786409_8_plen_1494_part_00